MSGHGYRAALAAIVVILTSCSADDPAQVIYLDRCANGCTVQPGEDSATENRSSLIDTPATLSAWRYGDYAWQLLVDCVGEKFAPFDVVVTDRDPGPSKPHHRAIVAGEGAELGADYASSLGVAPTWCEVHDDVITFTFANSFDHFVTVCEVVAQETGHALGMEHSFACDDVMSYISPCGKKLFRDADMVCGDTEPLDECRCGGTTINSFRALMALYGPSTNPTIGPEIAADTDVWDSEQGTLTSDGPFNVFAQIEDDYGIDHVSIQLNGVMYAHMGYTGWEYSGAVGDDVSDGLLDIEVVATDRIGLSSSASLQVVKRAACQSSDDCLYRSTCREGRCEQPVTLAELGASCTLDAECVSHRCEPKKRSRVCTQGCYVTPDGDTCPDGYWCHAADLSTAACWPGKP